MIVTIKCAKCDQYVLYDDNKGAYNMCSFCGDMIMVDDNE